LAGRGAGHLLRASIQTEGRKSNVTIVGIIVVIILILLAIYLFQRVRGGARY